MTRRPAALATSAPWSRRRTMRWRLADGLERAVELGWAGCSSRCRAGGGTRGVAAPFGAVGTADSAECPFCFVEGARNDLAIEFPHAVRESAVFRWAITFVRVVAVAVAGPGRPAVAAEVSQCSQVRSSFTATPWAFTSSRRTTSGTAVASSSSVTASSSWCRAATSASAGSGPDSGRSSSPDWSSPQQPLSSAAHAWRSSTWARRPRPRCAVP